MERKRVQLEIDLRRRVVHCLARSLASCDRVDLVVVAVHGIDDIRKDIKY